MQSLSLLSGTRSMTSSFLRKKLRKDIAKADIVERDVSKESRNPQWADYYECNKCEKVYIGAAAYILHAEHCVKTSQQQPVESQTLEETLSDELQCLICEDIFFCGANDLESHLMKHSNSWDFKMCHICSFGGYNHYHDNYHLVVLMLLCF